MCVALYDGSDVLEVAPHRDGDRVHTVEDCLAELEAVTDSDESTRSERGDGSDESSEFVELTIN